MKTLTTIAVIAFLLMPSIAEACSRSQAQAGEELRLRQHQRHHEINMSLTTQAIAFFNELPFVPPLFSTSMGDAMVHLAPQSDGRVIIKWLASISRGSGRAALTTIVEAADRHKIGLELTARRSARRDLASR